MGWGGSPADVPPAIASVAAAADGRHALLVAATGAGKTLAGANWLADQAERLGEVERLGERIGIEPASNPPGNATDPADPSAGRQER